MEEGLILGCKVFAVPQNILAVSGPYVSDYAPSAEGRPQGGDFIQPSSRRKSGSQIGNKLGELTSRAVFLFNPFPRIARVLCMQIPVGPLAPIHTKTATQRLCALCLDNSNQSIVFAVARGQSSP
ncbi:hypothetical protein M407DRAFT_26489 [Tulasnella calospora MUT 4182]|uniref:Uncharacterized protein n=1 Tax=Tulasnella calospora MUT 4182 TaxID=1051891 RepID=A0A0C3Q4Y8_9AGAM|nr:hypothetical protein M407DRAFT_26489 [Tulasnella calospora MUT 4182]